MRVAGRGEIGDTGQDPGRINITNIVPRAIPLSKWRQNGARHFQSGDGPGNEVVGEQGGEGILEDEKEKAGNGWNSHSGGNRQNLRKHFQTLRNILSKNNMIRKRGKQVKKRVGTGSKRKEKRKVQNGYPCPSRYKFQIAVTCTYNSIWSGPISCA